MFSLGRFELRIRLFGLSCLLSCFYFICGSIHGNCNSERLKYPEGSIKSPGYPHGYRNHTACTWVINKNPEELVTISFNDLDIEEDPDGSCPNPPCCKYNWVKIAQGEEQKLFCGQNKKLPESFVFKGKEVKVKFHSSLKIKGGRGFQLDYIVGSCLEGQARCKSDIGCYNIYERCNGIMNCKDFSDELDCGSCPFNQTSCGLTSNHCYNPYTQHCNRVLDCPNGADELTCEPDCDDKILCNSGVGCYTLSERCDGVPQCRDDSDEKYCNSELCRSERGGFLCGNGRCIREIWSCDRTNDCGDWTDEVNCLKNSVITAAVMGSLICGLLLVVAISCSCKLYALRNVGNNIPARETPLSRLEREFLYREPPPSYAVAVGDPRAFPEIVPNPGLRRGSHRHHGRRSRNHRLRAQIVSRPSPIVEESSESLRTEMGGMGSSNRGIVLDIERRNSRDIERIPVVSPVLENSGTVTKVIAVTNNTSNSPRREQTTPIHGNQSTSNNLTTSNNFEVVNMIRKSESESSLSESQPQSSCDRLPLLTN